MKKKKQIGITYRGLITMELINEKEIYVNSTELAKLKGIPHSQLIKRCKGVSLFDIPYEEIYCKWRKSKARLNYQLPYNVILKIGYLDVKVQMEKIIIKRAKEYEKTIDDIL